MNKPLIVVATWLCAATLAALPAGAAESALSFEAVLLRGLANAAKLKQTQIGLETSAWDTTRATSAFLPKLDVIASTQRIKSFGSIPSVDSLLLGGADSANYANAQTKLGLNIFNGGADLSGLKLAREKEREAALHLQLERQEFARKVLSAYHELQQAQLTLQIHSVEWSGHVAQFSRSQADFSQGRISALDLADAEFEKKKKELEKNAAERKHSNALRKLLLVIGADLAIEPIPTQIDARSDYQRSLQNTGFEAVDVVSEVTVPASKIKQSQWLSQQSLSRFLPKIDLYARIDHAGLVKSDSSILRTVNDLARDKSYFGITFSWNLFDGFDSYAQVKIKAKEIVATQEAYRLALEDQQRGQYELEQALREAEDDCELAREKLRLMQQKRTVQQLEHSLGRRSESAYAESETKLQVQQLQLRANEENQHYLKAKRFLTGGQF